MFLWKTDLDKVKKSAKALFLAVPVEGNPEFPAICCHPFTNSTFGMDNKTHTMIDYKTESGYETFKNQIFDLIDKSTNVNHILMLINKPYYMFFLKVSKEYLSLTDFSKMLRTCWTSQEYTSTDPNVNRTTIIKWFREACALDLEDAEERSMFLKLQDKCRKSGITVYRGVIENGKPNGLSWTTSKKVAQWFSNRFYTGTGKVYKMVIKNPSDILAYFNNRNENEVIVDTSRQKNWEIIEEE